MAGGKVSCFSTGAECYYIKNNTPLHGVAGQGGNIRYKSWIDDGWCWQHYLFYILTSSIVIPYRAQFYITQFMCIDRYSIFSDVHLYVHVSRIAVRNRFEPENTLCTNTARWAQLPASSPQSSSGPHRRSFYRTLFFNLYISVCRARWRGLLIFRFHGCFLGETFTA